MVSPCSGQGRTVEVVLDGLVPSKKNSRINLESGVSIPSAEYKAWLPYAQWKAKDAWRGDPVSDDFSVHVTMLGLQNDVDNCLSSIMDAFQGIIWTDDRQVKHAQVVKEKSKVKGCRVLVAFLGER